MNGEPLGIDWAQWAGINRGRDAGHSPGGPSTRVSRREMEEGAPMTGRSLPPHIPSEKPPGLAELVLDLKRVLKAGLPLTPALQVPALLAMRGVWARAVDPGDPLARLDAADRLLRAQLKKIDMPQLKREELPEASQRLFGTAGGKGKDLTARRADAAVLLHYDSDHFRKRIEPKIVEQLAWQLHRDSLQYVPRGRRYPPAEASGDTPVISEQDVNDPERAEHEILVSRIWSEVYGLRADLIERELQRGRAGDARFKETDESAELRLGALLTYLDDYMVRYGDKILHGEAEFKAEALIRLAGWRGDLTEKQARELRWRARMAHQTESS
jgi:hypothetical protein